MAAVRNDEGHNYCFGSDIKLYIHTFIVNPLNHDHRVCIINHYQNTIIHSIVTHSSIVVIELYI